MKSSLPPWWQPFFRAGRRHFASALADKLVGGRYRRSHRLTCTCDLEHGKSDVLQALEKPVFFVYRAGTSSWGSVRLRVFQLASALRSSVMNPDAVRIVTEEQLWKMDLQGADIVASKYVFNQLNSNLFHDVRSRRNRIFADVVDGFPAAGLERYVNGYFCASRTEFQNRVSLGLTCFDIPHPVDSRFELRSFDKESFILGYLGGNGGSEHLNSIGGLKNVFTDRSLANSEVRAIVPAVNSFSHHLSVRTFFGDGVFKPATKAYVAARFGAVFVGSRDDVETVSVLGERYPYLADSSSLEDVEGVIQLARTTFHESQWQTAVARMNELRRESCDLRLGQAVLEALNF